MVVTDYNVVAQCNKLQSVIVRMYYTCNTGASYLLSGPSLYSAGRYASYAGKNLETKSRTYNALISERQNEGCIRRTDS